MLYKTKMSAFAIMDDKRRVIARGTANARHLVAVNEPHGNKRVLLYSSQSQAKGAYGSGGFYCYFDANSDLFGMAWDDFNLEPVKVDVTVEEVF